MTLLFALLLVTVQDTTPTRIRIETANPRRGSLERARRDSLAQVRAAAAERGRRDAYADAAAEQLVAHARGRRAGAERLLTRYQVTVTQRIGAGVRALRRDRMLFGQELAARVDWRRDGPTRIEVIGARQRIPVAQRGDQVPDDLDAHVGWLVFDPSADYLRLVGDDAEGFSHPLREHSEADYRFATGDTTTITLPEGRSLRVAELRVTPRRPDFNLMAGSLWFDLETYGLVRAVFAPARPFDFELDAADDDDDVPGWVKPIRAEIRYVTIEYALHEFRWWLPRYLAMDAEAQASALRMPLRFEREYTGYLLESGTEPVPGARLPAGAVRPRRPDSPGDTAAISRDSLSRLIGMCVDSIIAAEMRRAREERGRGGARVRVRTAPPRARGECRQLFGEQDPWPVEVTIAGDDTASLVTSPVLGAPILQMGDVIGEDELRRLAHQIGAIPERPWQFRAAVPQGVGDLLRRTRYNRIEALSVGAGTTLDFGRLQLDALGRLGVADLEPNGELGLARPTTTGRFRLAAYRRLAAANPDAHPFGAINSLSGLLLGRDDGEYFRHYGVELTGEPAPTRTARWRFRLFAERQHSAAVETDASLPRLFNRGQRFRSNITAARAGQVGGAVSVHLDRSLRGGATVSGDVTLDGAAGDYDFGRGSLALRVTVPLAWPVLGLEAAAGTSAGTLPVQSFWFLGGPATLRGYDGGALLGEAFWRVRGEVGTSLPLVRATLFSDWGWAGPRPAFANGRPLVSAGAGASFLDGIIRLDLARGLRSPRGWRFDFYVDGVF